MCRSVAVVVRRGFRAQTLLLESGILEAHGRCCKIPVYEFMDCDGLLYSFALISMVGVLLGGTVKNILESETVKQLNPASE